MDFAHFLVAKQPPTLKHLSPHFYNAQDLVAPKPSMLKHLSPQF
jgi:hypothetical protein